MEEIKKHIIYDILKTKYDLLVVDYVILSAETYAGFKTHKEAVIKAFEILSERYDDRYEVAIEKMAASVVDVDEFLKLPDDDYYNERPKVDRHFDIPKITPYWYAFLEPPYGLPYLTKDFVLFNDMLFPNKQDIVVYRWNDAFSNYFNDGKEWWGTGLWSVYDKGAKTIVIIGASVTD